MPSHSIPFCLRTEVTKVIKIVNKCFRDRVDLFDYLRQSLFETVSAFPFFSLLFMLEGPDYGA